VGNHRGGAPPAYQGALEVETKYAVDVHFVLPDLSDLAACSPREPAELTATYFDTDDLRLARAGVTLRRRTGGSDEGWHLKLPAGPAGTREELAMPLAAAPPDGPPPAELLDLVTALARRALVRPVATLRSHRSTLELAEPGHSDDPLAELVDDRVEVLDGGSVVAEFRELELELRPSDDPRPAQQLAVGVAAALAEAGAVGGSFTSKAARALGAAAEQPPDVPAPSPLDAGDPAGSAVQAFIATQVRALVAQDPRVRRGLPDAVHQMRVACRRLRSALKVFEPLLDPEWSRPLRDELGWLAGALGAARDGEVLQSRLLAGLAALPDARDAEAGARVVHRALDERLVDAQVEALAALHSDRYLTLLDVLVEAARRPPLTAAAARPCRTALPPLVAKAWRRLARDVDELEADGPDAAWHEARIAAKRARYACESVTPALGAPAKRLAKRLEIVTELLGQHQDAAIAADTLRALAHVRGVSGRAGFALGLLHAAQRDEVAALRADFAAVWPKVSAKSGRAWLEPRRGR
jgi:CHAD domain-containing protein